MIYGYPVQTAMKATVQNEYVAFPCSEMTTIRPAEEYPEYVNESRSFVLNCPQVPKDQAAVTDLVGMSGSGVWARPCNREPGKLWHPELYLAGIQNGWNEKDQIIVATRLDRLMARLEEFYSSLNARSTEPKP